MASLVSERQSNQDTEDLTVFEQRREWLAKIIEFGDGKDEITVWTDEESGLHMMKQRRTR